MAKLTKSQRVKLIENLANHLGNKDYTAIDMTLKQFFFPIANEWSGTKEGYVISMIDESKDDDLIELAAHFGVEVAGAENLTNSLSEPNWQLYT